MYAMVCTHLEITYALSVLSIYMEHLGKTHCTMKWKLWYLSCITNVGLVFENTSGVGSYADRFMVNSNYVVDHDKRRSLTGYVFTLLGCAVS